MFIRKKVLFVVVLVFAILAGFCFLPTPALAVDKPAAQEDKAAKSKAIEELLYVMRADSLMKREMDQLIGQMSKILASEYPDSKEHKEFINELKSKINVKEILQLLVPIYDKYYTYDDIEQLIKFYKSPIGQKMLSITPDVASESIQIGIKYVEKSMREVDSYKKTASKSILTACKCNLKNIGTALEMYATDNNGYYPPDLKKLNPLYLEQFPQCPVKGMNYVYEVSKDRKSYILYCNGEQHKDLGITGPAYTSTSGLAENIKDAK